jgi:uncharacterized protein (DUF362 family)
MVLTMSTVYFSQNGNREHFVDQILEIFTASLQKAKKVFVKPNIVSYEPYPTTSHPEVLEAVLKRLGGCEVVVGDAPAIDAGRSSLEIHRIRISLWFGDERFYNKRIPVKHFA